jgi:hypothetical protein
MQENDASNAHEESQTFIEGLDFYFDAGLMVLTRRYLAGRGYCCNSGCRHCPYDESKQAASQ